MPATVADERIWASSPSSDSGLVIAIEPSLMAGGRNDYRMADDGWSLCSGDGSRTVRVEHSVAITDDGPVVLTLA